MAAILSRDIGLRMRRCSLDGIMMIAEGAEARVYPAVVFGRELAVKRRERKAYRVRGLDLAIRRGRTRREAMIMQRLSDLGLNVPHVFAFGRFSIYMERLHGTPLRELGLDAGLLKEVGRLLAVMHNNDIVHGDFTPANLMLCGGRLYLIDFGLSEISMSGEEKALDLLLMKRSIKKDEYGQVIGSYMKKCNKYREVLERLSEIELRGRYQIRTLA